MDYPVIDVSATGKNIKRIIKDNGYRVGDIANYLGTDTSSICRYLRGDVLPNIDKPMALSALLGVTANDIIVIT